MGTYVYATGPWELKPEKLHQKMVDDVVGQAGPWAVEGTTLGLGKNPLEYELNVPAPPGSPAILVHVTVRAVEPAKLAVGAHLTAAGESIAGPGRLILRPPTSGSGSWTAEIQIDDHLLAENVRFVAGHELDEIAWIVTKLPPTTNQAAIEAQMKAGIFTREPPAPVISGNPPEATGHDHAAAVELFDLVRRQGASTKLDEQRALGESMARLMDYMALDDPTNLGAKLALLAEHGTGPEWQAFIEEIRKIGARTATARAAKLSGGSLAKGPLAEGLFDTEHIVLPKPHSEDAARARARTANRFFVDGISGGHDDAALRAWVKNSELGYALGPPTKKEVGDYSAKSYDQYFWDGSVPGPPQPFAAGTSVPPGWLKSDLPKTTVSDVGAFLKEVDAALTVYLANFNRGMMPVQARLTLETAGKMPVVVWIQGGRIVSCYPDGTWF